MSSSSGGSLARYIAVRLMLVVPMIWVLLTIVFVLLRVAPGDPVSAAVGGKLSEDALDTRRAALGLDRPLWVQYGHFLGGLLRLDLGRSTMSRAPVLDELRPRLPVSLTLAVLSMGVAVTVGVLLGVLAALGRRSWIDYLSMSVSVAGLSTPTFVLGLILILAVEANALVGSGRPTQKPLATVSGTIHAGLGLAVVLYLLGAIVN